MKSSNEMTLWLIVMVIAVSSCGKKAGNADNSIVYQPVNKQYVLIRDVGKLMESDDEISKHIDSILTGTISSEFISTGQKLFDLNSDKTPDIGFEIIDLNQFNPNGLPATFDSLAARALPLTVEILDNSTFHYPDALLMNDKISESGNWTNSACVLGTFLNAGQFQGKGERYLGVRFPAESKNRYGWIRIYCSQHNDTLRIIDYAYNTVLNSPILAGQKN